MKNLYDNIRIIPESLQQYMTEFHLKNIENYVDNLKKNHLNNY